MAKKLTLEEIKALPREFLTPQQIAGVLQCNPYAINLRAKKCLAEGKDIRQELGFPVYMAGSHAKIPKRAFVRFMEGESEEKEVEK